MKRQRDKADLVQISLRTKEPLRAALESAATEKGVSMNAEIVDRLMQTFENDSKFETEFHRRYLYAILRVVAVAMDHAGHTADVISDFRKPWVDDPFAYDQAMQAAVHVLEAFRPHGPIQKPPRPVRFLAQVGIDIANGTLQQIINEQPTVIGDKEIPPRTHRDLGHLLARIFPKSKGRS